MAKGRMNSQFTNKQSKISGADPGYLERGVHIYKGVGFTLLIVLIFLQYPIKMK